MFDDLRKEGEDSPFFQQEESVEPLLDAPKKKSGGPTFKFSSRNFLGMNAFQRFVIAMMIMILVTVMGLMFLLVSGSIVPF